jgi:hypothetical protein
MQEVRQTEAGGGKNAGRCRRRQVEVGRQSQAEADTRGAGRGWQGLAGRQEGRSRQRQTGRKGQTGR